MTVYTTYFAALEHDIVDPGDEDAVVAVARYTPDWFDDQLVDAHYEDLGAPRDLADAFRKVQQAAEEDDDVDDADAKAWRTTKFGQNYRDYLTRRGLSSQVGKLRQLEVEHGAVWLVCHKTDPQHCHRRLVAEELTRGRDASPVHRPEPTVDAPDRVPNARLDEYGETA